MLTHHTHTLVCDCIPVNVIIFLMLYQGVVKIRDSKFGIAMVMETTPSSGNYVLGFRVDPVEKLKDLVQEIHSLYQVYHTNPIFGVEFKLEEEGPGQEEVDHDVPIDDDSDVVESPEENKKDAIAVSDDAKLDIRFKYDNLFSNWTYNTSLS